MGDKKKKKKEKGKSDATFKPKELPVTGLSPSACCSPRHACCYWSPIGSGCMLTRVRAQMAGEGVPPATGVAAQVTLEGLLARVELDVAQQVALLGERGAALAALERTLPWGQEHNTSASLHKDADK